jgi:sugar lactone lactonase YvrE
MSIRTRIAVCGAAACVAVVVGAFAADGQITTFAGTTGGFGDGEALTIAKFNQPEGLGLSADGATVLIADANNHRIRKLDLASNIVSTAAGDGVADLFGDGGQAVNASVDTPTDVAFAAGSSAVFYIADSKNHRIRRVAADGTITTYAGTSQGLSGDGGPATTAQFNGPRELAIIGDALLVADAGNNRIRRIDANGIVTTVAGSTLGFSGDGGPAISAQLNSPRGVTPTADGGFLIADAGNSRIRKVDAAGTITTVGGSGAGFGGDGGNATDAKFANPSDVVEIGNGGFIVADTANNRIRRVTPLGATFTISGGAPGLGGDGGPASAAQLNTPNSLQFAPGGGLLVGDTANHRIRRVADFGQVPAPELFRSVGVVPVSGTVTVKPRARAGFIPLREADLAPNISDIDATAGQVDVTVRDHVGQLRTVHADRGTFLMSQPTSGSVIGDLKLTERLDGCRGTKAITTNATTKKVRRLRVRVKGKFRTTGRYASAIARGTAWTMTDLCDRTLIRVTEGTVMVRILRSGRFIKVRAGQTRTILAKSR